VIRNDQQFHDLSESWLASAERLQMLRWALMFLLFALIAGLLELTVLAGTSLWIAKVLFVTFLVLLVVSLFTGRTTKSV